MDTSLTLDGSLGDLKHGDSETDGSHEPSESPDSGPESVAVPVHVFRTHAETRDHYIKKALQPENRIQQVTGWFSMFAPTTSLGKTFGLGVGLYFKLLEWLFLACLLLLIFALPFIIVIQSSKFTDSVNRQDASVGVKLYSESEIYSYTFASIIDSSLDNNTLGYLNTHIAYVWKGPLKKGDFLAWICVLDVIASLLVFCGFIYAYFKTRWFLAVVDGATLEVSDFTILVRGLPRSSTVEEVGEYFEKRFGVVMDVVLVTNLSMVLQCCAMHKRLEGQLELLRDRQHIYSREELRTRIAKLEKQAAAVFKRIEQEKKNPKLGEVRSALVTFDRQVHARNALQNCPSSWLTRRWHMGRAELFRGTHTFWVKKAATAEDYIFENLPVGAVEAFFRKVFVYAVVGGLIVISAFIITKLASISTTETEKIYWYNDNLNAAVAKTSPHLLNGGFTANSTVLALAEASLNLTAVVSTCGLLLPKCGAYFSKLQGTNFSMTYGSQLVWGTPIQELLKESNVYQQMQDSYAQGNRSASGPSLSGCLPCWCQSLSAAASLHTTDSLWKLHTQAACAPWVDNFNLRYYGVKIGISFVISVVNFLLKFVLSYMVILERRWTRTHEGLSYSLMCYTSTFLNSVVVLLLVNMSALHTATNKSALTDSNYFNFFILNGTYDDFSPEWYNNVGLSIQILLVVNLSSPFVMLISDWSYMKLMQLLVYYTESSTQEDYNVAWTKIPFTMEQRAADAMLNISLTLLFGSGMPLVYLFGMLQFLVQNMVDRAVLTKVCSKGTRYSSQLAGQILTVFPYLVIGHVAFGLWMHTHFSADTKLFSLKAHGYRLTSLSNNQLFASLDNNVTWQRITQPNGILLFATILLLLLWLVIRQSVWNAGVWLWKSVQPSDEEIEIRLQAREQSAAARELRIEQGRELKRKAKARAARARDTVGAVSNKSQNPTTPSNKTATPHSSVYINSPAAIRATAEQPVQDNLLTGLNSRPQGRALRDLKLNAEKSKDAPLPGVIKTGVRVGQAAKVPLPESSAVASRAPAVGSGVDTAAAPAVEVGESREGRGFWQHLVRQDQTEAEILANLTTTYREALMGGMFTSVPTYRLRSHPTYIHLLDSELYNELWTKAMGHHTYTRLTHKEGTSELFTILEKPQLIDTKMTEHMESHAGHLTRDIIINDLQDASRDGSLVLTHDGGTPKHIRKPVPASVTSRRNANVTNSSITERYPSNLRPSAASTASVSAAPARIDSKTSNSPAISSASSITAALPLCEITTDTILLESELPMTNSARESPTLRPSELQPLDTGASVVVSALSASNNAISLPTGGGLLSVSSRGGEQTEPAAAAEHLCVVRQSEIIFETEKTDPVA